jgi:putative Ca2+/H+ antiporter (TMEM165/GDT1 family)
MDWKYAGVVFGSVFLAELGDKTQLATLMFATDRSAGRLTIFVAAAAALVLTSALAVLLGGALGDYLQPRYLRWAAGLSFVAIGVYTIWKG